MSDFTINGNIHVTTTGVEKALAELQALDAQLKTQRSKLAKEEADARVKAAKAGRYDWGDIANMSREIRRSQIASNLLANGIKNVDDRLVDSIDSALKFNRVQEDMVRNFKKGNLGDPAGLNYFRNLATTTQGLEEMRRALSAAELAGMQVPQTLRQAVKEADAFEASNGRLAKTLSDLKYAESTRELDGLSRAMSDYERASLQAAKAQSVLDDSSAHHVDKIQAEKDLEAATKSRAEAQRRWDTEAAKMDAAEAARRKAINDDSLRNAQRLAQAKAYAAKQELSDNEKLAASERKLADARRNAEYGEIAATQGQRAAAARRVADAVRDEADARRALNAIGDGDVAGRAAAQTRLADATDAVTRARKAEAAATASAAESAHKYQTRIRDLNRELGYARMGEDADFRAVSEARLAAATRDVADAQTRLNRVIATGNDLEIDRAREAHVSSVQRQVRAQSDLTRAIQFQNGVASQNRYAMYDMAQTYGMLAAIPAAGILGTGIAAGWWESQMTGIARTAGLDTLADSLPGGGGRSRTLTATEEMAILERQMIRMGDVVPSWIGNITEIAKIGGQLGVSAKDLSAFTGVIAQFQAVSDVTDTSQIAESFGRIGSLRGTQDYRMIADAIANVGVNSAATDAQIIKTTQEIAQAGAGANFTTQQLVGMAGGFASLAVPPERARSVLQQFVQVATRGLAGSSDSMQKFAGYMGITEDAAKSLFRTDPSKFMVDFSKALSDMSPEEIVSALNDVGLSGQRAAPVFQALAKDAREAGEGMGVFETAIHDAVNSSGALTAQFAPLMDDLASSWQRFLNTFTTTAATTGGAVAPVLGDILDSLSDFMKGWREFASTDFGSTLISAGSVLGGIAAVGFGLRAGLAGMTGMALAIRSVSAAAGGGIVGNLKTIGSTLAPFPLLSGNASSSLDKTATSTERVSRTSSRAGVALTSMASATGRSTFEMGRSSIVADRATRSLTNASTAATRAATGIRGLGAAAVGLAGGPAGVALLGSAAGIGIMTAITGGMQDSSKKSVTETAQLMIAGLAKDLNAGSGRVGSSFADAVLSNFDRSATSQWGTILGGSIFTPGMLSNLWGLRGVKDIAAMQDPTEFMQLGFDNLGKSWWEASGVALQASDTVTDLGNSIADTAAYDLPMAQRMMAALRTELGVSDGQIWNMINSNEHLRGSFLDAANAAGVQVGTLETFADRANFLNFVMGELSKGVDGSDIAGLVDPITEGLTRQIENRVGDLQYLNASTQAAGNYYTAVEGIGEVVELFGEKYAGVVDLWDQSTGMWNITNADTAALALSFEDLAANALSMANVFAETGNYEAANNIIGSTRDQIAGLLDGLGVAQPMIDDILEGLQLADDLDPIVELDIRTPDGKSTSQIVEGVQNIISSLEELPAGTVVKVDALTDQAVSQIQEAGYHVEELSNGEHVIRITADGAGDAATTFTEITGLLDTMEEGAEIVITDPTPELLEALEEAGLKLRALADGTYVVTITEEYVESPLKPPPGGYKRPPRPPETMDDLGKWFGDGWLGYGQAPELPHGAFDIGDWDFGTGKIDLVVGADVLQAIAAIDGVKVYVDSASGDVVVTADTEDAVQEIMDVLLAAHLLSGSNPVIPIGADTEEARSAIEELLGPHDANINVNADPTPADRAIQRVATADRTSTIRATADDVQAESDLNTTARPRPTTITAGAEVGEAERVLNRTARNRPSTINVGVNGGGAESTLNYIARDRTSTITVNVNTNHHTTYTSSGDRGISRTGGYGVNENAADGGYAGAGPKWQPAGIYHAGEYIIPKRDVDQTTGLPNVDALGRMMRQQGGGVAPTVIVQQGGNSGITELGPTSIHAIARAVQPLIQMDGQTIASGVSQQFANSTRKGAH